MSRLLLPQIPPKTKNESPEIERFQAEMAVMAEKVFAGVRLTALQGLDAALAVATQDQPDLHSKAQNLANQVADRTVQLNKEIQRFFCDSRRN